MKTYDINDIQFEMNAAGSHWWDRGTMKFFSCRVSEQVYQGPGGIYFVTSEKRYDDKRSYTVRQYNPQSKDIDTVGDFNSLTRPTAHKIAARLANTDLQDQFDEAMCELDRAVTGKDKSEFQTRYVTIEEAKDCGSRSIMYLSDGGYTRIAVKEYDDSSGYYLTIIPTFADEDKNTEVRTKFNSAYDLQRRVRRILKTEPAGKSTKIVAAVHRPTGQIEQLAMDLERNGCAASEKQCRALIRLSTKHHKMMEDYCNGRDPYDSEGNEGPALKRLTLEINNLAAEIGCKGVHYSGDPRGCTVKLILPNDATNDWGKDGWCVPTKDEE